MHFFNNKDNVVHTLLRSYSTSSSKKQQLVNKKESLHTLDSYKTSTSSTSTTVASSKSKSIRSLAQVVMTSIADSGVNISRSGPIIGGGGEKRIKQYNTNCYDDDILSNYQDEEVDRMVSQHYILRTAFDDMDFSAPISFNKKKNMTVLDIGCGSGTWTMELATQFPHAKFIGIDKKFLFPRDIKPINCHFQLFNITSNGIRLPFEDASVDFIFQRDMNWGLEETTWLPLVREYFRILKPGGWIELVEPDIETHSSSPYEDLFMNKLVNAFYHRRQDPFIAKRLSSFMATAGFRRIQSDFKSIPLGWGFQKHFKQHQKTNNTTTLKCSEFARAAVNHRLDLLKSLQPWFSRENHISEAKYEAYINQLPDEWYQSRAYTNWHRSTAQKPVFL